MVMENFLCETLFVWEYVETSTRESGKCGFICCRTWIMLYISVIVYACMYEEKDSFFHSRKCGICAKL